MVVADTLLALQRLAADVRNRFKGPVVGITGSVGKTTTRALTGATMKNLTLSYTLYLKAMPGNPNS